MVKEIDFDELDRAVSSLMGSIKKEEPSTNEAAPVAQVSPSPAPVSPSPPSSSVPSPALEKPTEPSAAAPSPVKIETKPPVAPPRRAGRFMDVVHPSADMQSRSVTPPSRVGIAITPRPSLFSEASSDSAEKEVKAPLVPPRSSEMTMPDPIAMSESTPQPSLAPSPRPDVQPEKPAISREEKEETALIPAGGESPFLPNAKVEKRPLGNEPPTGNDSKSTPSSETKEEVKDDSTEAAELPSAQAALPAELNNDLVTIESKELTTHTPAAARVKKEEPISSGPTSISQQYKEQPSSGDSDHAPIYDAEQIPQPLVHPPKKKAGWLWIIWVVLLLIVGAGGAALLYATGIIP